MGNILVTEKQPQKPLNEKGKITQNIGFAKISVTIAVARNKQSIPGINSLAGSNSVMNLGKKYQTILSVK